MKGARAYVVVTLALLLSFFAGSLSSRSRAEQNGADTPPVVHPWGSRLTVYYPAQKKMYVYTELGGNCVFIYTVGTQGAAITRENCR